MDPRLKTCKIWHIFLKICLTHLNNLPAYFYLSHLYIYPPDLRESTEALVRRASNYPDLLLEPLVFILLLIFISAYICCYVIHRNDWFGRVRYHEFFRTVFLLKYKVSLLYSFFTSTETEYRKSFRTLPNPLFLMCLRFSL